MSFWNSDFLGLLGLNNTREKLIFWPIYTYFIRSYIKFFLEKNEIHNNKIINICNLCNKYAIQQKKNTFSSVSCKGCKLKTFQFHGARP